MPLKTPGSNNIKDKLFDQYWNEDDENYPEKPDSDIIYQKLNQELFQQSVPVKFRIVFLRTWISYIAASVLFFLVSFYLYKFISYKQNLTNDLYTLISTKEERKILILPDSSKVELFEHSNLEYNSVSSNSLKRSVKLTGKARFSVVHDPQHPFKVYTNDLTVEDIGTVFTVSTDLLGKRHHLIVKVDQGRVRISYNHEKNRETTLGKGESMNYENGQVIISSPSTIKNTTIVFDNSSFANVLEQLSCIYGKNIKCLNPPGTNKTYTGTFKGESLQKVLDMIGFTLGFKYYNRNNEMIVYFNEN